MSQIDPLPCPKPYYAIFKCCRTLSIAWSFRRSPGIGSLIYKIWHSYSIVLCIYGRWSLINTWGKWAINNSLAFVLKIVWSLNTHILHFTIFQNVAFLGSFGRENIHSVIIPIVKAFKQHIYIPSTIGFTTIITKQNTLNNLP